ncbi:hypothetical protein NKI34_14075 [Mesorhizobium sp. M0700]|uniref:hypothetical protein n=1 Tax=Mesorhizobium sp. M0700 TaxID=2956988 RepID=UPI003335C537
MELPELHDRALAADPHAEYDRLARAMATPKQLDDIEEMPNRVTYLSLDGLKTAALDARRTFDEVKAIAIDAVQDEIETETQALLVRRSMLAEYLWRRTCLILADEFQRRRTGVAPRAKGLN